MAWSIFIPLVLGTIAVLQSGLNKEIGAKHSFSLAVVINGTVLLTCALLNFILFSESQSQNLRSWIAEFKWTYLLPGAFGFLIVLGLPFAIQKHGALKVFICFVIAQTFVSWGWDYFYQHEPLSPRQIVGAALALLGVILLNI